MIGARSRSGTVSRIRPRFVRRTIWLPECNSVRTRPGWVEADVRFRIVYKYKAPAGHHGGPVIPCREQPVEIALGPKGAFENANLGAIPGSQDQLLDYRRGGGWAAGTVSSGGTAFRNAAYKSRS
jgi:hypothetical protein